MAGPDLSHDGDLTDRAGNLARHYRKGSPFTMPARLDASRRRLDGLAVLDDDDDGDGVLELEGRPPGLVRRVSRTSRT